jgi:DNA-binding response OmpR family regulator
VTAKGILQIILPGWRRRLRKNRIPSHAALLPRASADAPQNGCVNRPDCLAVPIRNSSGFNNSAGGQATHCHYNGRVKRIIYVVEDDADIARLVRHQLEAANYLVRIFANSTGVITEAQREHPSLFVLDIMVPGADGLELCRLIRQAPTLAMTPVIFLTAKAGEADRVLGLELGADDYITKPFSPRELVARVKAVLRRFEQPLSPAVIHAGDVELDSGAMTLIVRGKAISTTATEFRLLQYLAHHPGRVFTRDQLLDAVWRDTAFVTPRSIDVYVRRLREKIERDPENPRHLKTIRGAGYRFEVPK